MKCPYCGSDVNFVDSSIVYNGVSYGMIYLCSSYPVCDSYVGVHKGTAIPLGELANKELREWRKEAHRFFDWLWQGGGMTKKQAYELLQKRMGLSEEEAHIDKFDIDQCKEVVRLFRKSY